MSPPSSLFWNSSKTTSSKYQRRSWLPNPPTSTSTISSTTNSDSIYSRPWTKVRSPLATVSKSCASMLPQRLEMTQPCTNTAPKSKIKQSRSILVQSSLSMALLSALTCGSKLRSNSRWTAMLCTWSTLRDMATVRVVASPSFQSRNSITVSPRFFCKSRQICHASCSVTVWAVWPLTLSWAWTLMLRTNFQVWFTQLLSLPWVVRSQTLSKSLWSMS